MLKGCKTEIKPNQSFPRKSRLFHKGHKDECRGCLSPLFPFFPFPLFVLALRPFSLNSSFLPSQPFSLPTIPPILNTPPFPPHPYPFFPSLSLCPRILIFCIPKARYQALFLRLWFQLIFWRKYGFGRTVLHVFFAGECNFWPAVSVWPTSIIDRSIIDGAKILLFCRSDKLFRDSHETKKPVYNFDYYPTCYI